MSVKLLTALLLALAPTTAYSITPQEVSHILIKNSIEIKIARKSLERAWLEEKATKREFFPRLNLSVSYSEFYPDFKNGWNQNYSFGAALSAEPVNFKRFVKLKISSLKTLIEEDRLKETILEQLYLALKELYTLSAYRERIGFKEEALKSAEEILNVAKEKYKKGLVMITDVLKAKSEVERVKGELSSLKAKYKQSFNRLNELLNFSLNGNDEPEVELLKELPPLKIQELIKIAYSLRPEVRRVKKEVKESSLQVKYTERTLWPSLNLNLSWNRNGTTFWPESRSYSAGVTLNFPIFDSGLTKLRSLAQKKSREISLLNMKKVKNRVKREVLDSVAEVKSSFENLNSNKSFLEFSQKAYDRTLNEYRLGVLDIVALLQAYDNLKVAQDRYVSSLLSYNLSLLSLKKATGELLTEVQK